ncbi:hypothetical protein [Amycolatopsis methanolica]|uniref:Uncharacterized protein n=1 Tax=Amycolatopsis methanolica 239 TaxID=1068978 RepID=A0A076MNJ9_AMYME|nr:hypothetical protein [Amycolatopsis methanolica]AIJ20445.1 hypothetical protein AMETH_0353 [Amycolatopsis methanolica 239]
MNWVRATVDHLSRREVSPAVPATLRSDLSWARAYVRREMPKLDTLEPESWLRPAN